MKTVRVLRDGWEIERIVERVEVKEETLYGGCPERLTVEIPQLEPGESMFFHGNMAVIRSRAVPG